jgi:cytidylate kinase
MLLSVPIITISRMYGSGGSEVAALVARALDWTLLDNALADAVAVQLGASPAAVIAHEERVPSLVARLADALTLGSAELLTQVADTTPAFTEERLLEVTHRVMIEAAAQGPVVVVGRGAQAMLAERSDAVHVFCCAGRAALVGRVRARSGLDESRAARTVDETNRQREQYVRRHWNRAWLAPENYHLCVNTELLGIEGAAALVVGLARDRFGGRGRAA